MFVTYSGETADEVWRAGIASLLSSGDKQQSRVGTTREILHVGFSVADPRQRWIVSRLPALNPAFAIAETIWILLGRNDSRFLTYWNSQLPKYVGDSDIYHGAYGHRLRRHFQLDQLERAYSALKSNSTSRQVILQIWDAEGDLPDDLGTPKNSDIPCNVMALIKVRHGKLEWMQINRSNDVFLGVPHNFVQFTTMQEILAGWLGLELGSYNHLSDSFHLYEKDASKVSIDRVVVPEQNTDSLMLEKRVSDQVIQSLGHAIERLITDDLTEKQVYNLSQELAGNAAYQNLFFIMCCEYGRRRGWSSLTNLMINQCTNPALQQLWERWLIRLQANRPENTK